MTDFTALPDLVIRNILRYLCLADYGLLESLTYCQISSSLRQLALPFAYKRVLFCAQKDPNDPNKAVWMSNIGLYTTEELRKLGSTVIFHITYCGMDFAQPLGPLLTTINEGAVEWPEEYDDTQLTGEIKGAKSGNFTYMDQSLGSELLNRSSQVLVGFASKFPSILDIRVCAANARETTKQFTSQLIGLFYSQYRGVELQTEFEFGLEYFPPNMRRLIYRFTSNTKYPLPKLRNPEKLESWSMRRVFYNCGWWDYFDVPEDGGPVVFSNLRTLAFSFMDDADFASLYEGTTYVLPSVRMVPAREEPELHCPRLSNLVIIKDHGKYGPRFNPRVIPSHLNRVHFSVGLAELSKLSKLPVKSIRHLYVCLELCKIENMSEFYRTTNRLLGGINNTGGATKFYLKGRFSQVDMKRIKWSNITELKLEYVDTMDLMGLLARLPLLKTVKIARLIYNPNTSAADLGKLKLTHIAINMLLGEEWTSESTVDFVRPLASSCPDLIVLRLSEKFWPEVSEMAKQDPQLEHIKTYVTRDFGYVCEVCKEAVGIAEESEEFVLFRNTFSLYTH